MSRRGSRSCALPRRSRTEPSPCSWISMAIAGTSSSCGAAGVDAGGSERALSWPARVLADLPDCTEMVGEMRDASDQPAELHAGDVARSGELLQPALRFVA